MMRWLPFDYAVRNLGRSTKRLLAMVLGNMLVVLLMLAAGSFVSGMRESFGLGEASENVIVLGTGSEESVERSEISAATPGLLAASVEGIQELQGIPFLSPEIVSALILKKSAGSPEELRGIVRGVESGAYLVHERVEVVEGRVPRAGALEIMLGSLAGEKLGLSAGDVAVGKTLWFEELEWTIVGRFRAKGTVMEGEIWMPLKDLMVVTKRDTLSCVVLKMGSGEFADVDVFTKTRVDLELSALRESDYYASLVEFYRPVEVMIWVTALLISLAGILGGFNTLYSAFSSRIREIGMLQSLGYSRRAILVSLVQESLLVSSVGFFCALGIAACTFAGFTISHSMGVFRLSLSDPVILWGAGLALTLGLLGALPPAFRCLSMPIPEALKSL
ncbi:MAG: FtsX-like permease family protein [Candidatus Sumerlaeia bacterium]|nr:FtsX-like permease family protein [Candidatus Sumerlaeia bacterium]